MGSARLCLRTGGFHDDWRLSVSTFAAGQDRSLPSRCTKLPWRHALLAEQEAAAETWTARGLLCCVGLAGAQEGMRE